MWILGLKGLRNDDDDDVNEKVAKKMNLCSFNLHRVYFHPVQFVKCFIELNS